MAELVSKRLLFQIAYKKGVKKATDLIKETGSSRSQVYKLKKRVKETNIFKKKKNNGRKSKLSSVDIGRLKRLFSQYPYYSNEDFSRKMVSLGSPSIHRTTIARYMRKLKFTRSKPKLRPLNNEIVRKKRLDWALKYENHDWKMTLFTDESMFRQYTNYLKVVHKKSQRPIRPSIKGQSFMVWGGISWRGKTDLAIMKGDKKAEKKGITAKIYRKTLKEHCFDKLDELYPEGYWFQQDNAPIHKERKMANFFDKYYVEVIDWPPYSPDLNPIENIWYQIFVKLEKEGRWLKFKEFKDRAIEIWSEIPLERVRNLIASMDDRVQQCISREGGLTDY